MPFFHISTGILSLLLLNASIIESESNVVVETCRRELEKFADSISNFTRCAVNEAAPFRFCRLCYEQFDEVRIHKRVIFRKNSGCSGQLVASERYQIVNHAYEFTKNLWDGSNCYRCFDSENENAEEIGSKWIMKPKVIDFFYKQENLNRCFKNYSQIPVNPVHPPVNSTSSNISMTNLTIDIHDICKYCRPYYEDMSKLYKELVVDNGGYGKESTMCADVLSAMNNTRHQWIKFNCFKVELDTASVVALTCFFCFFPIIFYSAAKIHGDSNNKKSSHNAIPQISYDAE